MKNRIIFLSICFLTVGNFSVWSQGPPMWSLNGNSGTSSSYIGTTNYMPITFKTNGNMIVKMNPDGGVRFKSLEGSGSAVVGTDANGQLFRMTLPNNSNYVLTGMGTFVPITSILPVTPLSGWSTTASLILADAGKNVGIGVSNPTDKLAVLGNVNIAGLLHVDSIQVGDSSLHIVSYTTATIIDPGSGTIVTGPLNEIYTDPIGVCCAGQGGVLFINSRWNSPGTRINSLSGNVAIGKYGTTSSSYKLYVYGGERVTTGGSGATLAFVDLMPSSTSIPNTSIEIGSRTTTGQIDFKGVGNLTSDFKGRVSYTDGTGFGFFTEGNTAPDMVIQTVGTATKVGIGTSSPLGKLTIRDGTDNNLTISKNNLGFPGGMQLKCHNDINVTLGEMAFDAAQFKFVGGSVKIGSNIAIPLGNPYRLYVELGILTEKVKVAVHTTGDWSDYTFADDYELLSLDSVENYTEKNKHLQGIPSAEEMVTNGNDLGLTDKLLLEKIENLFLYLFQLNKEIKLLNEENKKIELLKVENELLKAQNELLIQQKDEAK